MTDPVYIHPSSIIDPGALIGEGTKIWHFCHLSADVIIGKYCSLGQNVYLADKVRLGDHVKVQNNVSIYSGVICEDEVFLGPSMVFTNVTNPRAAVNRKDQYVSTLVKRGATIGANATIVCGHILGEFCFIGAGTVITKDVPPYALMVGNPGRQMGWMSEKGFRLNFNENQMAICEGSGDSYELVNHQVRKL